MTPVHQHGRQKPLYYRGESVVLLGHYEIANGGVDTLKTLDEAYDIARMWSHTHHVVMEGKCMSDGSRYVMDMVKIEHRDVRVLFLDTSVDQCIESVRTRGHSIADRSIRRTYAKVQRDFENMQTHGINCVRLSRNEAVTTLTNWLQEDIKR